MGKTAICIQMLELLNTGRKFKIAELADLLETNERNVIEYKKELEEAGYYITSGYGKYGGYKLDNTCLFPSLKLTDAEKKAIEDSYSYLISKKDFLNKPIYEKAMGKVISSFKNEYRINPLTMVEKNVVSIVDKNVEEKYNIISNAIESCNILNFTYLNSKNNLVNRIVEPYKLYIYNSNWFLLGYSRDLRDFRSFKLARIEKMENTFNHFSKDPYFKDSDYFDEYGFKKNNEWYSIKLKVNSYQLTKLQEQKLGKNQKVEFLDKYMGILSVDMQYKQNIYNFVLSLGLNATVLEPKWLVNDIKAILEKMADKY